MIKNKILKKKFSTPNTMTKKEVIAASKVIKSGILSQYVGDRSEGFMGGKYVKKFEKKCCSFFKSKYAVAVNSWTSGLTACIGSLDIEPGDEVIVPTWTMCATATAIIQWNAIPIFADIEEKTFNIDVGKVEKLITKKTKAILAVDIFGHPCDYKKLRFICNKHKISLVSDSAQSIYSFYNKKISSTLSDVGGFSLNYHKHIHTGEGGIIITNKKKIYERLIMIRNHAEAIVSSNNKKKLANMIGSNFRFGEIESAIGLHQIDKIKNRVKFCQNIANIITRGLKNLKGLRTPIVKNNCTHSYYVYGLVIDVYKLGISRKKIVKELQNEGVPIGEGYVNLHLLPMFQNKIAYGSKGFPWTLSERTKSISYKKGICPVAEELHDKTFIAFDIAAINIEIKDAHLIVKAFKKVWKRLFNEKKIQ